jgi:hypothetical protein
VVRLPLPERAIIIIIGAWVRRSEGVSEGVMEEAKREREREKEMGYTGPLQESTNTH